jgi:hypothetical protein
MKSTSTPDKIKLDVALSDDEKKILAAVHQHFRDNGTWITSRRLQAEFGKKRVQLLEQRLNPPLIQRYTDTGKEVYKWSPVGFFLNEEGKDDIDLLCRYLDFMKKLLHQNPEIEELTCAEVENGLSIDKKASMHLLAIISNTNLWTGGQYNNSEGMWTARVPHDAIDLIESASVIEFLENRFKNEVQREVPYAEGLVPTSLLVRPNTITEKQLGGSSSTNTLAESLFPLELFSNSRIYIKLVAEQCCGSYDNGYYDAASVMARRLLETLIIEVFEAHKSDDRIKNSDGSFFYLSRLIPALSNESDWNLSRGVKKALPRLKDLGDQSAHNRRYLAKKADLDSIKRDFRVAIEELLHLSMEAK